MTLLYETIADIFIDARYTQAAIAKHVSDQNYPIS
jgi:hypothetical protein